jgi:hypothetical protein
MDLLMWNGHVYSSERYVSLVQVEFSARWIETNPVLFSEQLNQFIDEHPDDRWVTSAEWRGAPQGLLVTATRRVEEVL